jgi:hypothetical protein
VKLGIQMSPRTVRRYMATSGAPRNGARSQRWSTFVRNHASAVLACDFFVVVAATFRVYSSTARSRRVPGPTVRSTMLGR